MRIRQIGVVWLLVALGIAVMAAPAIGLYTGGIDAGESVEDEEEEEQMEKDFGIQVSTFAQTSAADASESVDAGIWQIRMNASESPDEAIENRAMSLADRMERLNERINQLEERQENLSAAEYTARASALRAQTNHMHSHVEQANRTASGHGVHPTALDQLRNDAANMTGPEVSELARSITETPGGPPGNAGPPDHAGAADDIDSSPPGEARGDGETDRGPPGDVAETNSSDSSQPEDARTSSSDLGPPEDVAETNSSDRSQPEAPGHGSGDESENDRSGDDTGLGVDDTDQMPPGEQPADTPSNETPEEDSDDDNLTGGEN